MHLAFCTFVSFHNGMRPFGYVAGKKDGATAKVIK